MNVIDFLDGCIGAYLDFMEGLWTEFLSVLASSLTLIVTLNGRPPALLVVLLVLICIVSMVISAFQWMFDEHRNPTIFLLAFLTTVIFCGISFYIGFHYVSDKSKFTGIVVDKRWHREWDVEQWVAKADSCWGENCQPSTSYDNSKNWENTGRRLKVGESCSTSYDSDGKAHESCTDITVPIYDWHEYYTNNVWSRVRIEVSSGSWSTQSDIPYWPNLKLYREFNTSACKNTLPSDGKNAELLGCQRPAQQRDDYHYTFRIQKPINLTKECELTLVTYSDLKIEQSITGEYWTHQFIADCNATVF